MLEQQLEPPPSLLMRVGFSPTVGETLARYGELVGCTSGGPGDFSYGVGDHWLRLFASPWNRKSKFTRVCENSETREQLVGESPELAASTISTSYSTRARIARN